MTDRATAASKLRQRLHELLSEWDAEVDSNRGYPNPSSDGVTSTQEAARGGHQACEVALKRKEDEIVRLEAQIKRYVETIIELKHSEDSWRRKYRELVAANVDPDATCTELQTLEEPESALDLAERFRT